MIKRDFRNQIQGVFSPLGEQQAQEIADALHYRMDAYFENNGSALENAAELSYLYSLFFFDLYVFQIQNNIDFLKRQLYCFLLTLVPRENAIEIIVSAIQNFFLHIPKPSLDCARLSGDYSETVMTIPLYIFDRLLQSDTSNHHLLNEHALFILKDIVTNYFWYCSSGGRDLEQALANYAFELYSYNVSKDIERLFHERVNGFVTLLKDELTSEDALFEYVRNLESCCKVYQMELCGHLGTFVSFHRLQMRIFVLTERYFNNRFNCAKMMWQLRNGDALSRIMPWDDLRWEQLGLIEPILLEIQKKISGMVLNGHDVSSLHIHLSSETHVLEFLEKTKIDKNPEKSAEKLRRIYRLIKENALEMNLRMHFTDKYFNISLTKSMIDLRHFLHLLPFPIVELCLSQTDYKEDTEKLETLIHEFSDALHVLSFITDACLENVVAYANEYKSYLAYIAPEKERLRLLETVDRKENTALTKSLRIAVEKNNAGMFGLFFPKASLKSLIAIKESLKDSALPLLQTVETQVTKLKNIERDVFFITNYDQVKHDIVLQHGGRLLRVGSDQLAKVYVPSHQFGNELVRQLGVHRRYLKSIINVSEILSKLRQVDSLVVSFIEDDGYLITYPVSVEPQVRAILGAEVQSDAQDEMKETRSSSMVF